MKRKFSALLLCLSLLLSSLVLLIPATAAPSEQDRKLYANYGAIDLDGDLNNDAMQYDALSTSGGASFGVTWDAQYLYIGMYGAAVTGVGGWQKEAKYSANVKDGTILQLARAQIVTDGGNYYLATTDNQNTGNFEYAKAKEATAQYNNMTGKVTGCFGAEFKIPMSEQELYVLSDGSIGLSAKLCFVTPDSAWHNFVGTIVLTDNQIVVSRDITGVSTGHTVFHNGSVNEGQNVSSANHDGINAANAFLPAAARTDDVNINAGVSKFLKHGGLVLNAKTVAQQDVMIQNMPEADLDMIVPEVCTSGGVWSGLRLTSNTQNPARAFVTVGFGGGNYTANSNGYVIYNTANGLYLVNDTSDEFVRLGVSQNVWFNLRLEIAADRSTVIKVNGEVVGAMTAPEAANAYAAGAESPLYASGLHMHITAGNSVSSTGERDTVTYNTKDAYVGTVSADATAALAALTVFQMPKMIGSQTSEVANNAYSVRFLAEVGKELSAYGSIGYDYAITNAQGKKATGEVNLTKVFETVNADGVPTPAPNGGYIAAFAVRGVPTAESESVVYTVTPWATTQRGEKITGAPFTVVYVNEGGKLVIGSALDAIRPDTIMGSGYREENGAYVAMHDLNLPTSVEGLEGIVTWESSLPSVISNTGILTRPTSGTKKTVTLTATLTNGGAVLDIKTFTVAVKPISFLWIEEDTDPYVGSATSSFTANTVVTADGAYNSIIADFKEITTVNHAVLKSTNSQTRLTKNFVSLYASNDNKTYSLVPSFTMQQVGNDIYFYNFEVNARYFKIHFTYKNEPEENLAIKNAYSKLMQVYYSTDPLLATYSDFEKSASVTVQNNTPVIAYDVIRSFTLADLGISASDLKSDRSDIRFRLGDQNLPHYDSGSRIYVRVPEIAANGSAELTVLYKNANAQNVSSGTSVLEVEYGTKTESYRGEVAASGVAWRNTVAPMPDGSLLRMGTYAVDKNGNGKYDLTGDEKGLSWERSTDGGRTWSATTIVSGTLNNITEGGGFVVDLENNVVFFLAYSLVEDSAGNITSVTGHLFRSHDSGQNWTLIGAPIEGLSLYSDGIKLSTYDGAAAGVDYVFPVIKRGTTVGSQWTGLASSYYSTDGGNTWILSESSLQTGTFPVDGNGNQSAYWTSHESGMTESTIWEKADGTLMMYSRYQGNLNGSNHVSRFVISYSHDHGKTWEVSGLSDVRTTETQPIFDKFGDDALLMWGGNNVQGFRSYDRFPLNIAYSSDDAETFEGILNVVYQTEMDSRTEHRKDNEKHVNITNPDIALFEKNGVSHAYILTDMHFILLENFKDFLYKTKGAFDSFENGSLTADGWVAVSGTQMSNDGEYVPGEAPTIAATGAVDGKYAMQLGSQSEVSRSVPYVVNGEIFFDFYVSSISGGFTLELQSAYSREFSKEAAPVRIEVDGNGNVGYYDAGGNWCDTGMNVKSGANTISITFNGNDSARISVNGAQSTYVTFNRANANYVCFVHMRNGSGSKVSIDRFGLIDLD